MEIIESTPLDEVGGEGMDAKAAAEAVEEAGTEFLPLLKVGGCDGVCGKSYQRLFCLGMARDTHTHTHARPPLRG